MSLALYREGQARQAQGRAQNFSIPAPVGGWNTRDSIANMEPIDAIQLDNWIPKLGQVEARPGYQDFVADIAGDIGGTWTAGPVETLFSLVHGSSEKFLAAMDGGIARLDTGTATELVADGTYSSNRWQWTVFADSAAPDTPKIFAVNGTDDPWTYDGNTPVSNWTPSPPTGPSVPVTSLIWIHSFKNRIYCGAAGMRDFLYTNLGDSSTLSRFPLSGVRGAQGNVLFMTSMTRDTGAGPDDYAVFVTDQGSAIVYAGSDPSAAGEWSLVGVYQIPRPIPSRRAYANLFGDVVVATELDYVWLAQALQESGGLLVQPSKLTGAMQERSARYKENYGWEITVHEPSSLLFSNIPLQTSAQYEQHCVNVQTRAASRFTNWNMNTMGVWNGQLYGGAENAVYRLMNGGTDDEDGAANPIPLRAQTAWTDLDNAENKKVEAVRPLIRSIENFRFAVDLGFDYVDPTPLAPVSIGPASAVTFWGDAPGVTTFWGDTPGVDTFWAGTVTGSVRTARVWRLVSGRGESFCLAIASNITNQAVAWLQTDYKVQLVRRF